MIVRFGTIAPPRTNSEPRFQSRDFRARDFKGRDFGGCDIGGRVGTTAALMTGNAGSSAAVGIPSLSLEQWNSFINLLSNSPQPPSDTLRVRIFLVKIGFWTEGILII